MRTAVWIVMTLNVAGSLSADEDWWQFRGPTGEGHTAQRLPLTWSENQKIVWKTAIHDHGWSSPVICGKQIWMTASTGEGHKLFAVCVDRETGKIVHDIHVFDVERPQPIAAENTYATPTPVIEPGRVYVHFGTYGTACLNSVTGSIVWTRRDLNCDHETGAGPCSSPFPLGNLLIMNVDGRDVQYVIALDTSNGKTVWKTDRSFDYATVPVHMRKAFTMPLLVPRGAGRQLVSPAGQAVYAYDPATGKEFWKVRHNGFSCVPRPVYGHGLVFLVMDHDYPEAVGDPSRRNGRQISHFHVADVPGRHQPGTGEINYLNVFRAIAAKGYTGFLGLEMWPTVDQTQAIRESIALLAAATAERKS